MSDNDDGGFFRNLGGLASDWVTAKRRGLTARNPLTNVDKAGGTSRYQFNEQEISHADLRDIKEIRESGGQIAQLMHSKALLNFGEGAEIHVEDNEQTETVVDGERMTLRDYLEAGFPALDQLMLELGEDALWYPYAAGEIRETRAGDFADFLPAQPWTLLPEENAHGDIIAWHEQTQSGNRSQERTLSPDEICHFIVNKNSARDNTGISEILRNKDELRAFKENERAINQAIELHGFPQRHVKVGREEGSPVSDSELRRVRDIFDPSTTDANTAYFTGQDVDVDTLEDRTRPRKTTGTPRDFRSQTTHDRRTQSRPTASPAAQRVDGRNDPKPSQALTSGGTCLTGWNGAATPRQGT